jgi:hypothetical protein
MKRTGPGKVFAFPTNWRWDGDILWADATVLLYNFDVDVSDLKDQHRDFLNKQLVLAFALNTEARITMAGQASLSGESNHNDVLSGSRAKTVRDYFLSKGVAQKQFMPKPGEVIALGDAPSGPAKEDERDRSVTLRLSFPLKIDSLYLYSDDWMNILGWDDIVGLDREADGRLINQINIQMTVWGAPKMFVVDGGIKVPVMPADILVRLRTRSPVGTWGPATILAPKHYKVRLKDPNTPEPDNMWIKYRLSVPINDAGDFLSVVEGEYMEMSAIAQPGGKSDVSFRAALGWGARGISTQSSYGGNSGSERDEIPDALRLLQAGGVEVLEIEPLLRMDPKKTRDKWLIRSPADVFYYGGTSKNGVALAVGTNGGAAPGDLQSYWKTPFDLELLILAGCAVLNPAVGNGSSLTGPGADWAKLLKIKGGPLNAILGYRDAPPADNVVSSIAARMGATLKAGVDERQWVSAWIEINAENPGKNTWNAVGIDPQGYWWIEKRGIIEKGFGPPKKVFKDYNVMITPI